MIPHSEAEAAIAAVIRPGATERVPLAKATGCILREEIRDPRPSPPFDRSTMDGVAISFEIWDRGCRTFRQEGVQAAGTPPGAREGPNGCFEIMTGAVVPRGCDTVVPVEQIQKDGDQISVAASADVSRGQFIHRRGSDYNAETTLLVPGTRLGSREIGAAASAGRAAVVVAALPRITVISSGDELVAPGDPIASYQIYRSNSYSLEAGLTGRASVSVQHVADDEEATRAVIRASLGRSHVLILTGGVSKGRYDFVQTALEKAGVRKIFHGVSQRPGKPLWFGQAPEGQLVFGLPGNPLSTLVCLHRYVLPGLDLLAGADPARKSWARLAAPVTFPLPLTWFLPVRVSTSKSGVQEASPLPPNTSGDYTSVLRTDGFLELPAEEHHFPAGYVARFCSWR